MSGGAGAGQNGRGAGSRAAREAILGRIRAATRDVPVDEPARGDVPRAYATASTLAGAALLDRFVERVEEYRARVHRVASADVARRAVVLARERGARRLAVAPGVPEAWQPDGLSLVVDGAAGDEPLAAPELDRLDGALTGCGLAIAETGTIVLDGGPRSGRRALTLVPDWHLCLVEATQVVGSVPEAIAALREAAIAGRPITLVSGPSATSDIELRRVEGVHGPRTLDVLLVDG
jgi:L-lactate dehydrogenase complex protein LldG